LAVAAANFTDGQAKLGNASVSSHAAKVRQNVDQALHDKASVNAALQGDYCRVDFVPRRPVAVVGAKVPDAVKV
jgi:hypothetical protein